MQAVDKVVSSEIQGKTALICLDNPNINALSISLREGLHKAIVWTSSKSDIIVIAIYATARTFVAGVDIKEFGNLPLTPLLSDLVGKLEQLKTPVISIFHGTALAGGFQIALGTHACIGITGLKVGLPEINFGLLPGARGTQRTPKLFGISAALDMILSGRHIQDHEALEMGLIDRLYDGQPRDVALRAAHEVLKGELETRHTSQIIVNSNRDYLNEVGSRLPETHLHLFSPHKCIDAICGCSLPTHDGLKLEGHAFQGCVDTPQIAGLIHAFHAKRAVCIVPESKIAPRSFEHIGISGGGTIGPGIATTCFLAGLRVTQVESEQDNLKKGKATIELNLLSAVNRRELQVENWSRTQSLLVATLEIKFFNEVNLVVDTAFEDMEIKKDVFKKFDSICKAEAVLASNTSFLDISEYSSSTTRPQDVMGLHFFSPAHVTCLLEIGVGKQTKQAVTSAGFALAKKLRKVGVKAGVCDGFIGNRILAHYLKAVSYMVLDDAHPQQIDQAFENFGFAMVPHKVREFAGLDIDWITHKRKALTRSKEDRYAGEIADRICESGWFGRKTARGYYLYERRNIHPNPDIDEIITSERQKAGISVQNYDNEKIVKRCMTAMISEAIWI